MDTSVPSLHSSGCDSGVGLTREINEGSTKHIIRLVRESQRRGRDSMMSSKRSKRCMCGFAATGVHVCSGGEESRYSTHENLMNLNKYNNGN